MRDGAEFFLKPSSPVQRQYEALRAYVVEGLRAQEVADRYGYSPGTIHALGRDLRAGKLEFFIERKPGPAKAPKRDAIRERVSYLRKQNYSIYDIQRVLRAEGVQVSHVVINQILSEEGFSRLPRRCEDERPPLRPDPSVVADVRQFDPEAFAGSETRAGGLFVFLPAIIDWDLPGWIRGAGLPGSKMIPALSSILSMLSLKLTGKERLSHVMDVWADPGFSLFAGLNALPKTTAISTYSYRVSRDMVASLLEGYLGSLTRSGMLPGESFNLDFHPIPHRGREAVLEKHYISQRSRSERAVLAFLVQDSGSRALCYANATVRKEEAKEEVLSFVEFWRETRGEKPPHLVFDSRLTTYDILDRLDKMGILFVTLRQRGPAMMRAISQLPVSAWKKCQLKGVSRLYRHVRFTESMVPLKHVGRKMRQIAVSGLGHDETTLFITNDMDAKPQALIERYAHRMLIENSIAENIDFFHINTLSSAIAIQVDLDLMLSLIANALYRNLARRLVGFEFAQPKQIFRRFLSTPAEIRIADNEVRVRLRRRAHHPILIASGVLEDTPSIPWWGGLRLRLEII